MRILYHHRTRSTDAQRIHIREIANAFSELGHSVEIVSLIPTEAGAGNAERDAQDAAWQTWVRRIPFAYELVQLAYNLAGLWLLGRKILAAKPDFLYERYALFNFAGVVAARLARIPIILEVNSPFALEQARDRQITAIWLARWAERVICNMASANVVVSTPLRDIMIASGVRREKLIVMPNGVRPEMFAAATDEQDLRRKLGIDGKVTIGFVGWLRPWHGVEMLVNAFHRARLAEDAALLIVGDGPAMAGLRSRVAELGLERSVLFTGPLPHPEIPKYVAAMDIAVQPAANEYCCPMKILEYMALQKPVLAPKQANICDVLRESEAVFFEPGNEQQMAEALTALVRDRNLRISLGKAAGRAIAEREYFWTTNAARVVNLVGAHAIR